MQEDNNKGLLAAGGIVACAALGYMCLKAIQKLAIEMVKTFDSLAAMTFSLFHFFWNLAIDVGLMAAVVAALYFTYRYVKMVREATALRELIESRISFIQLELKEDSEEFRKEIANRVFRVERKLHDALKQPELAPEKVTALDQDGTSMKSTSPAAAETPSDGPRQEKVPATIDEQRAEEFKVSAVTNPY